MRRSFLIPLLLGALTAWCGSCIENNLPYPVVELAVLSCEGEGFTAEIDAKNRTVVLRLDETTDISRVRITDMRITAEPGLGAARPANSTCARRSSSPSRSTRITNGSFAPSSGSNAASQSKARSAPRK